MRRRLWPEGLDIRVGTPENRIYRVRIVCGITSPGAAFCAAPPQDSRGESTRQGQLERRLRALVDASETFTDVSWPCRPIDGRQSPDRYGHTCRSPVTPARKSVVQGKRCSSRLAPGGRPFLQQ